MRSLRVFRATAKAAGGILDLVMPMRVGGDGPSLFCVHPMIGLSWCYLALLPHVDARYPLYGVQARGVRQPEPLPVTMLEMARDYADQIRKVQPVGPYHLLGWSLGGNIAFAIAEEFERRGEQIGLLVILDSYLADLDTVPVIDEPWRFYNIILAQFGYVPAITPADPEPEARMLELVRRRPGLGLDEWPDQRVRALQRVIRNNIAVMVSHQPGRVHCPMLFFSCADGSSGQAEKLETWRSYVDGPIEAVELACDHNHILLPEPVARIGPALTGQLARAAAAYLDSGVTKASARHAELDALSDEDQDELLRAALAERNRRRATASGSDSLRNVTLSPVDPHAEPLEGRDYRRGGLIVGDEGGHGAHRADAGKGALGELR
jgi:thioesterase domain-containing protein